MHFIRMWKSRVKSTLFQAIKKIINRIVLIKKKFLVKFQIGKKANVSVCDLILNNSNYNELLRWDIIVRYLAIEEYYHKNDFGFKLYRKMQAARIEEKYSWVAVTKFKNLIRSYDNKGYDEKSRIVLDKKLRLVDGSHRIALALYYNIKNINALIIGIEEDNSYSIDWFLANGFSSDEINIINKKYEEIYSRINHSFSCVIWSPAVPYKDEILHDLGLFGRVISVNKRQYRKMEYENVVRAIYAIDDIAKWKIDKKLEYMKEYDPECVEVNIQFDDPEYRIKKSTGLLISMRGERLKKAIREKYKSRINNYFFDIIIHIGDNVYQSEYMRTIFDPGIDLNKIITILDKYPYALAKTEVPYYPIEFPDKIPVGKDVDVFCRSEDINIIKDEIVKNLDNNKYDIIIINSPCGIQIRLQIGGLLIFLIDMIFKDKTLGEKFIKEAINTRIIKNSFQVINRKYEYIYRMNAYACNRGKKHHKEYLINNRADYDKDLVKEYLDIDLENLLY